MAVESLDLLRQIPMRSKVGQMVGNRQRAAEALRIELLPEYVVDVEYASLQLNWAGLLHIGLGIDSPDSEKTTSIARCQA